MILQAMLGGAAGLFVAIKMFGVRMKNIIFFWRKDEEAAPEAEKAPDVPARREPTPKAEEVKSGV
jgi:hypothetical protein